MVNPQALELGAPAKGGSYGYGVSYGSFGLGDTIRDALAIIRRNLWLILGIIGFALICALVTTMLDTPRYSAATSVQINDQSDQVFGSEIDTQSNINANWDVDRFLNTQLDILRSRALAERVARKLGLFGDGDFHIVMGSPMPDADMSDAMRRETTIDLLQDNMEINLPRDTRIVWISFDSTEPEMSAKVVNAFAEEFIQSNLQRRFDSSAYARNFIAEQLDESRISLEASERELNAYAREAGLIRMPISNAADKEGIAAGSVTTSSLMQINAAANDAQATRIVAEGRWQAEQATPIFSSQAVLSNPTVQMLMGRRAELEAESAALEERYLEGHPSVEKQSAELAKITQRLNQVAGNVRNSIRSEYAAAAAAERHLQAQVKTLQSATLAEQDRAVRYNTLAREADTNRTLYDGLLQRYRELNAASGIATSNLAIIDRADVPSLPSSPNLFKNLAIALVAGLAIAGMVVFLRDQLDDVIRLPEDIEEKVQLPLLGIVPRSQKMEPEEALDDPKSPISEAYGSLRGALLYSSRSGLPKILLITSAQPTEGKSTTAYATAMGFSRMGRRVLLVDADMRRPSVHKRIGNDNQRGLSSLLVSADPFASAVVASGFESFDVLGSGPIPPSPTELLTSPRMASLLEQFAEHYDVVILDSPPVLGLADAPALAALADGVMLVIEAERGRRGALKATIKRLRAVDAVMLGAVLTKFDPSKSGNRHSGYFGYDYYRHESADKAAA